MRFEQAGLVLAIILLAAMLAGGSVQSWFSHELIGSENELIIDGPQHIAPEDPGRVPVEFNASIPAHDGTDNQGSNGTASRIITIINSGTIDGFLRISFKRMNDVSNSQSGEGSDERICEYLYVDITVDGGVLANSLKVDDYIVGSSTGTKISIGRLAAGSSATIALEYHIDIPEGGIFSREIPKFNIVYVLEQYVPGVHD